MLCNRNSVPVIWVLTTSSKTLYPHSLFHAVWKLEGKFFPITWYLCYFKCTDPTAAPYVVDLRCRSNAVVDRLWTQLKLLHSMEILSYQTRNDRAFLIKSSLGLLHWFCEAMSLPVQHNIYLIVFWCCSILLYQIFSYFIKDNVYPYPLLFTSHWSIWIIIG